MKKTKTYNVHPEVIKASIADLLSDGLKITKQSITKNIDDAMYRIITLGRTDLTLFPNNEDVDYDAVQTIYNKLYK
jgi:hypothetical protein